MRFNFFRHKKAAPEPRVFEGRFITDEEIDEMVSPKSESFIKKEFREINGLIEEIKQKVY